MQTTDEPTRTGAPKSPDRGPLTQRGSLRWLLLPSLVLLALGVAFTLQWPQYGGVVAAFGFCGLVLGAVVLGMTKLGRRRGSGQSLRSAP